MFTMLTAILNRELFGIIFADRKAYLVDIVNILLDHPFQQISFFGKVLVDLLLSHAGEYFQGFKHPLRLIDLNQPVLSDVKLVQYDRIPFLCQLCELECPAKASAPVPGLYKEEPERAKQPF